MTGRVGAEAEGGDAELHSLEQEYARMEVEEQEALVTLRQLGDKEKAKGEAVRNQQVCACVSAWAHA